MSDDGDQASRQPMVGSSAGPKKLGVAVFEWDWLTYLCFALDYAWQCVGSGEFTHSFAFLSLPNLIRFAVFSVFL